MKTRALLLSLLLAAVAGCQQDRSPSPEAPPAKAARSASGLVISTTGQSTERADKVMGRGKAGIERLASLPELEQVETPEREPGARLRPAMFLTFEERTKAQVVQAYASMWKRHAGGYEVLVPSPDGWQHVLQPPDYRTRKLACAIDVITSLQLHDDFARATESLRAGCAELARSLSAKIHGQVVPKALGDLTASLKALRKKVGTEVKIDVLAPAGGFRAADVHRVARALGFLRSDLGSYAWYNPTDIGTDRLTIIRPTDEPYVFDFAAPDKTYSGITLWFELDSVPVPQIVVERLLTAAAVFARQLGGRLVDAGGKRLDPAALEDRVAKAIDLLGPKGLLVPARVAD